MTQLYRMHKTKPVTFQRQVNELKHRTQKEVQAIVIAWTSFHAYKSLLLFYLVATIQITCIDFIFNITQFRMHPVRKNHIRLLFKRFKIADDA